MVAAVARLRAAGWFEALRFSSPDLARAAQAAWRHYEGSDIPSAPDQMYWRLLVLDASRTWSDDVDAGGRTDDRIYTHLVDEVSISGARPSAGARARRHRPAGPGVPAPSRVFMNRVVRQGWEWASANSPPLTSRTPLMRVPSRSPAARRPGS
jgi:hypothetical protein